MTGTPEPMSAVFLNDHERTDGGGTRASEVTVEEQHSKGGSNASIKATHSSWPPSWYGNAVRYVKLMLPAPTVALLLSPFVFVHPVRRWMGQYSFLCYVFF